MRFTIAAAAFLATAVSAEAGYGYGYEESSTSVYKPTTTSSTKAVYYTTTSSTKAVYYPATTPVSPPVYHNTSSVYVPGYPPYTVETYKPVTTAVYGGESSTVVYQPTGGEGYSSVVTISTCVPTTYYSTVTIKPTAPYESAPYESAPAYTPVYSPVNATSPAATGGAYPTAPPEYEGAASSIQMSAFAAALGLAAFILA